MHASSTSIFCGAPVLAITGILINPRATEAASLELPIGADFASRLNPPRHNLGKNLPDNDNERIDRRKPRLKNWIGCLALAVLAVVAAVVFLYATRRLWALLYIYFFLMEN